MDDLCAIIAITDSKVAGKARANQSVSKYTYRVGSVHYVLQKL